RGAPLKIRGGIHCGVTVPPSVPLPRRTASRRRSCASTLLYFFVLVLPFDRCGSKQRTHYRPDRAVGAVGGCARAVSRWQICCCRSQRRDPAVGRGTGHYVAQDSGAPSRGVVKGRRLASILPAAGQLASAKPSIQELSDPRVNVRSYRLRLLHSRCSPDRGHFAIPFPRQYRRSGEWRNCEEPPAETTVC